MIMVDTLTVTLDELDEIVINMVQHVVDQALAKEHPSSSSAFVYVIPKREIIYKFDNVTIQFETISKALSSS